MKVFIEKKNKLLELKPCKVSELLKKLDISPSSVIIIRNNEVVLEDELLSKEDNIKLVSVVSGG